MTGTKPPKALRCTNGHRIVWDADGKGCTILGAEDNRVLSRIKLDRNRWQDIVRCSCGASVSMEQ
jgi:hypothetical protein